MTTRERQILEQSIKAWVQEHTSDFTVADYDITETALNKTAGHFTWLIRQNEVNVNLSRLVDYMDAYMKHIKSAKIDGMSCNKCHQFIQFAEPNQEDGTMVCYGCRANPYF
jgi:formylmethanofuran dehydrogenase subunit E